MTSTTDKDDVVIDSALLRTAFGAQARAWAIRGPLAAAIACVVVLAILPQWYSATTSVAIQQATGDASSLSVLTGGKTNTRYIGVLKSRTAAEQVMSQTNFMAMYGFESHAKAIDYLLKHVKVDDDATSGLLNITVSLPGPPHLSIGGGARTALVKKTSTDAANDYVAILRSYYVNNDNDREAVILRSADTETKQARADYDDAVRRLSGFAASLRSEDPRSIPNPGKDLAPPAADEIGDLYSSLAKVETQLRAVQASVGTTESLTAGQLGNLNAVPTEDPLLSATRGRVAQDKADLQSLQVTYGPDHPSIILAKNRLAIDQTALKAQASGVTQRQTTEQVQNQALVDNLSAQRASIESQIAASTQRLSKGRNLSGMFASLQAEVDIRLNVLKTTLSEAAKVRMQYASLQSRLTVIDTAIPAETGEPRLLYVIAAIVALVFLGYLISSIREYTRLVSKR